MYSLGQTAVYRRRPCRCALQVQEEPLSTTSTLLPSGDHKLFSPAIVSSTDSDRYLTSSRMSLRQRLQEIGRTSRQRQLSMMSTISTFERMRRNLRLTATDIGHMPTGGLARRFVEVTREALEEEEDEDMPEPKVEYENLKPT